VTSILPSRRDFLKAAGRAVATVPLIGTAIAQSGNQPTRVAALKGSAKSVAIPTHEYYGDLDERLDFPADWEINVMNMKGYGAPVLTNVQVRYKEFDAYDVEPPATPDLFAQRPLVVFGKWRGPARGSIEVSGRSGPGDYAHTFELSDTKPQVSHGALRYLWARSRIARLADFAMGRAPEENKEHITQLGLEYSLLTQYTSFVAVLEEIRNTGPRATDVDQPLPLPLV